MIKPSEKIRNILSEVFPQNKNFEKSPFPINIDYSLPFYEIDKKRIIVYQTDGLDSQEFIGDEQLIRNFKFEVVVASNDSNEAFNISNFIYNYLRKYKDSEYIKITPVGDISPMGQNSKKMWLYACTYSIMKNK